MQTERFFKHDRMPFAEARYSRCSTTSFNPHMHRSFSVGAVDLGQVCYTVGPNKGLLKPGGIAVINPETLHSCNPTDPEGRSYYMLYLDVGWCFQVQQTLWNVDGFIEAEHYRIEDADLYHQYCQTMEKLMQHDLHLQEKEQQLFDLACGIFMRSCRPQAPRREQPEQIEQLKELLRTDLQNDLPLQLLARDLGTNPYTLIRHFKAVTGITPHAYRMNCRIEQAKHLLREGRDIADTALLCGFFDQSHLHRHFKSMTSITPREYRVNFVQ